MSKFRSNRNSTDVIPNSSGINRTYSDSINRISFRYKFLKRVIVIDQGITLNIQTKKWHRLNFNSRIRGKVTLVTLREIYLLGKLSELRHVKRNIYLLGKHRLKRTNLTDMEDRARSVKI